MFLDRLDEVGPSISSSVVLCSFVPLVYIIVLVLAVYLCPSSVRVVATFSGTVLFPLLCSVLPFFPQFIDSFLYLVLLIQIIVAKISSVLLLNVVPLFSSVSKFTSKFQCCFSCNIVNSYLCFFVHLFSKMSHYSSVNFVVCLQCVRFLISDLFNPYPTAFPYGNGMVLHFYQQQESSTTKTVHKVINKGLKTYV